MELFFKGQIEAQGTFEELSNSKLDFTKMLSQVVQPADKNKDGESEIIVTGHSITSKHGLTLSLISVSIYFGLIQFDDGKIILIISYG